VTMSPDTTDKIRQWIKANPHQCWLNKKGQWAYVEVAITVDAMVLVTTKCKECGFETFFDFDISSRFSPEVINKLNNLKASNLLKSHDPIATLSGGTLRLDEKLFSLEPKVRDTLHSPLFQVLQELLLSFPPEER